MPQPFPGFSPKAITFLRQLKNNNTREWFQPRKERFEELLRDPMLDLVEIILNQLRTFAVDHVIDAKKVVPRIYRDVRFSSDKSPYKTSLGARFYNKRVHRTAGAGFYLQLSSDKFTIAGGIYLPGPAELKAMRTEIAAHPAAFRKIVADPKLKKLVGPLMGEQSARIPKLYPQDHPAADLLRMKKFYFATTFPVTTATTQGVEKLILKHFKAMAPAIAHMNQILIKANRTDHEHLPIRPQTNVLKSY